MRASDRNGKYFWLLNLVVVIAVFCIPAISHFTESHTSEYRARLSETPHYVTKGFSLTPDLSAAGTVPAGESPRGELLGSVKHAFLRPGEAPYEEFTITASFDFSAQYDALKANPCIIPGIMIIRLGDSYEIYLNGNLIVSEWYVEGDEITQHRLARDLVYAINPDFFVRGENTLTFRVCGDPTTVDTGLTIAEKYAIDDLRTFTQLDIPQVVFAGIYFAVAVVFAAFFLLYRDKKLNLWFSLGALSISIYTLFKTNVLIALMPDYSLAAHLEIFVLFSFTFFAAILIYSSGKEKLNLIMKIFVGVYIAFCAALCLPGRQFLVDLITIFYVFFGPFVVYAFVASLLIPLAREIKRRKRERGSGQLLSILSGTMHGNMLIASFIPVALASADQIIFIISPYQEVLLSQYGFLFFFANITFALASNTAEMYRKLITVSGELRELVSERESELAEKSGEIAAAKTAQMRFMDTVSKEIRAPLGEIIGAIELRMLRSELSSEASGWLRRLLDAQRDIRAKLDGFLGNEQEEKKHGGSKYNFEAFSTRGEKDFGVSNSGGTRHLFVINPKSFVTLKDLKDFLLSIEMCFSAGHRAEYKVYISRYPRDAYSAVHRYLSATPEDEIARVYAVGGDGILFDCLNGLARFPNAELAPIPYGNANDFARAFGAESIELFRDIRLMSKAPPMLVDVILCGQQFALCSCSIGIEAKAVQVFSKAIERINFGRARYLVPLLYKLGAVKSLFDGSQNNMGYSLTFDGQDFSGDYLLINVGNIALNGGGNTPNPFAVPDDGELDVITSKSSTIINSLRMLPAYTTGQFSKFPQHLEHRRLKEVHCKCDKLMSVILDGETFYTREIALKILPKAVKIVSPNGIGFADFSHMAKGIAE